MGLSARPWPRRSTATTSWPRARRASAWRTSNELSLKRPWAMAIVATGRQRNVGAVAKFLSGEWVDAVNTALAGAVLPPDLELTVAHIVDDIAYVVRVQ